MATVHQRTRVSAMLIACLGLFGLSTLAAVRRTKEVGIRKVLGAGELSLLAAGLVLVALITVSYQSLRTALRNPVESLRHE